MRIHKRFYKSIALTTLLCTGFAASSIAQNTTTIDQPETNAPTIVTTNPIDGEMNFDLSSDIEITFSSEMDESTINENTLLLHASSAEKMHNMQSDMMMDDQAKEWSETEDSEMRWQDAVKGTISYSDNVAVFTPDEELEEGTMYTFTITTDVKNMENIALDEEYSFSFTTLDRSDPTFSDRQDTRYDTDRDQRMDRDQQHGMERDQYEERASDYMQRDEKKMIELGKASQFVILAKTTINNESESNITGRTGEGSDEKGLKKEKDVSETERQRQRTTGQLVGQQTDQYDETDSPDVNEAIEDMMYAYSDASAQNGEKAQNGEREQKGYEYGEKRDKEDMDFTTHKNDHIPDEELKPGVHQWNTSLNVHSNFTLSGNEDDVWLFKVTEDLVVDEDFVLTLSDGAQADNVFWYVEGEVIIGKNAHFEGIILSMNEITLEKGAMVNGRLFSQASITLDDNTITEPEKTYERTSSTNK